MDPVGHDHPVSVRTDQHDAHKISRAQILFKKHRQLLKRNKVKKSQVKVSDSALKALIEGYARQAGVRNLEKLLLKILRKAIVRILGGEKSISVTNKNLDDFVGQPIFRNENLLRGVGIVTGLAWTSMGGATLPIEATRVHDKDRGIKITGQLGDVMKESASIAFSYATANAGHFGIDSEYFTNAFIHLHVPEGATPKDGPSAGVTMTTAILSLALNKAIRRNIAMTGEITLTGKVLAVGGIREKIIAARRLGIKEVILPDACRRDFDELPEYIVEGLIVHFAREYQDVFDIVF